MGMFDDLRCHYPLPIAGANAFDYQTKSLDCDLDQYEIREDGSLWREVYDERSEKDPAAPFGFWLHKENCRWEHQAKTGEVRFYKFIGKGGWIEWMALFVRGELKHMELVSNVPQQASTPVGITPDLSGNVET